MPIATIIPECVNCGAALDVVPGHSSAKCKYCKRTTFLTSTTLAETGYRELGTNHTSLLDELSQGPRGAPVGVGSRFAARALPAGGVAPANFTVFPVRATASSTYGGSWSPDALIGPPNVFPSHGDRSGAWAPQSSRSNVEWIEVEYDAPVPIAAIRVLETNVTGSTYAIVDRTDGDTLLWAAAPQSLAGAQMLEVAVSPARRIRRLRIYVVNPGGWTEIDTVALITSEPLPPSYAQQQAVAARTVRPPQKSAVLPVLALFAVITAIVAASIGFIRGTSKGVRRTVPTGVTEMSWSANATAYRGNNGASFTIQCSASGSPGVVWGSGPYTDDSSLCGAAAHAGRISLQQGGTATIEIRPGESSYRGSSNNNVTSRDYGSWSGSFVVR